MGKIEGVASWL